VFHLGAFTLAYFASMPWLLWSSDSKQKTILFGVASSNKTTKILVTIASILVDNVAVNNAIAH
jgi:hypothetical protein